MKRALVIFILVVAFGFGFVLLFTGNDPQPSWRPTTQFTFLCFTNAVTNAPATNALIGIRRIPHETTSWHVLEISHREGTEWKAWVPLPSTAFGWFYPKPTNFDLSATIPVETTAEPFRVVIELQREPTGKMEESWQLVRRWLSRLTRGTSDRLWKARLPRFCITNEFDVTDETRAGNARPDK